MTPHGLAYSADDVALLVESGRLLAAAQTVEEVASVTCQLARRLTTADGAAFLVRDGDEVVHVHDEAIGTLGPLIEGRRFGVDDCLSGSALRQATTIVVPDITADARIPAAQYGATFVESLAMAPIGVVEPVAVVAVYWARVAGPLPRSIALLEALATFAAGALESVRRNLADVEGRRVAEAASRAKDEFLATLGHELRNPLAPIVTVLSLIKIRGPDPFDRERQIIERQVQHVVRLVDDLLDISRIARGAIQLRRAPVELAWIVARALETAGPAIAERGHDIHVDVPATGLAVDADVDRFTQVIANLLTNAAKYTPRGGLVEVAGDVEGTCARLVVRDSGIGIAARLLPRMFDLFSQARPEREGGLGLGLSIVRSIVELHGGVVSAASEGPGRGATFTVRVPLVASGEAEASEHGELRGTRPLRILVVDDNIDAAETLGDLLAVMGHDAVVVHDGPAALAKVAVWQPEIAFLDIGLPVVDGYALAERLREVPALAAVPMVAVTGYGREADRQRGRAAGFAEHLVKPLSAEQLRAVLGKLTR